MKAQELRIGNWVEHNSEWCYRGENIYQFQWDDRDWYALGECTLFLNNISAIPLTEEWLLKLGFERGGYDLIEVWHPKHPRFVMVGYLEDGDDCMGWNYNNEGRTEEEYGSSWIEIKYVHQLQNLFHALTGEELTYENN